MNYNILRSRPVYIERYLPEFIQNDPILRGVLHVDNGEHERMRKILNDILDQFFVESATWGLSMWEHILDIAPEEGETTASRRKKILVRLRGTGTSTVAAMNAIVSAYGAGYIVEHNEKNYFSVYTLTKDPIHLKKMRHELLTYKPAHLDILIYLGYSWDGAIAFDGTHTYSSTSKQWKEGE